MNEFVGQTTGGAPEYANIERGEEQEQVYNSPEWDYYEVDLHVP